MLKDFFDGRNLEFSEKLVDQDDAAREEMSKESNGFLGVPFTVIEKDDGTKEHIIGFDKGKLEEVLGAA